MNNPFSFHWVESCILHLVWFGLQLCGKLRHRIRQNTKQNQTFKWTHQPVQIPLLKQQMNKVYYKMSNIPKCTNFQRLTPHQIIANEQVKVYEVPYANDQMANTNQQTKTNGALSVHTNTTRRIIIAGNSSYCRDCSTFLPFGCVWKLFQIILFKEWRSALKDLFGLSGTNLGRAFQFTKNCNVQTKM